MSHFEQELPVMTNEQEKQEIAAMARDLSERDITSMPWLPQLPELWAEEIYERIEDAERRFAAPNLLKDEYIDGIASENDQIEVVESATDDAGYVFTAEHATTPFNIKKGARRGFPDAGTAGLVSVMGEEHGKGIIMVGHQTSNAPSDPDHPIKPVIARYLPTADGFLSVHGMARGKFMHPLDRTEVQASIGLGDEPDDHTRELAERVVALARDELGLYVVIGNDGKYFVQKENSTDIKRNDDGEPYRNQLAAFGEHKTTNFARRHLAQHGNLAPSMQIELTKFLRIAAIENETRDRVSKVIGVALGYKLIESVVELTQVKES